MNKKRESKGIQIFAIGDVKKLDSTNFLVHSQSNKDIWYNVQWKRTHWGCDCIDHQKYRKNCKHIHAVNYYLILDEIKIGIRNHKTDEYCPICGKKDNVIKRGIRYNRSGAVQRFYCKACRRRFTGRMAGFEGMKTRADIITASLDLYYRGLSLRAITQHLEAVYKVRISHGTIYYWIKKYVTLVNNYLQGLSPNFSCRWHADEVVLQVNARHLILWSLMDSETRYLIASHISQKRGQDDASTLLKKGLETSEQMPEELITDGLKSYNKAIAKEFSNLNKPIIHLQGSLTKGYNNKMERINRTIKSRMKTMAGLCNEETSNRFTVGFAIFYNYIRNHMALGNMTPAMMAGVSAEKENWLNLIIKSKQSLSNKKEN